MKKLTVTLALMLAPTLSMTAAAAETSTSLSAAYMKELEIPRFHHRNDGIALFAKNETLSLMQVMTDNPLYPFLVILSSDAAGILTALNQRFNALLTETEEDDWRSSFVFLWPTKTTKPSYL